MEDKYIESIDKEINWIIENNVFGFDFKFTEGQREVITQICDAFLKWKNKEADIDSVLLSAPTGYGKSIISMFTSKVLQRLNNTGYILTVDLALQQQYENDFRKFRLGYHSVKGMDNYKCNVNNEPFSKGDCHELNLSYKQLQSLKCYGKCGYLQARMKAMNAKVSLLNYSYWLIQRNRDSDLEEAFKRREFIFFDECHKIDDIIQNHFSIKIKRELSFLMQTITDTMLTRGVILNVIDRREIAEIIEKLFESDDPSYLLNVLRSLNNVFSLFIQEEHKISKYISSEYKEGDRIDSELTRVMYFFKELRDYNKKITEYVNVVETVGLKNIIKRYVNDKESKEEYVEFLSLKDDYLVQEYLIKKSGFKIFMSATMGNISSFANIIGLKNAIVLKLKPTFNYDKSPIYVSKQYSLDFKNKMLNIKNVIEQVDAIIDKHFSENGIIHTSSFEFTQFLLKYTRHKNKFITYTSHSKRLQIKKFLNAKGKILVGPSIVEGLDLKDDLCRFQIFLKIPFPNIGDVLVKAKLNESREWYLYKTTQAIVQGSNRGVRHKNDFCDTYIVDASIINLLKEKTFDIDFMKRVKIMELQQ